MRKQCQNIMLYQALLKKRCNMQQATELQQLQIVHFQSTVEGMTTVQFESPPQPIKAKNAFEL